MLWDAGLSHPFYCTGKETRGNSLLLQLQGEMLPEQEAAQSVSMYLSLSFFLHPSEFHFLNPVMYRDPQMTALPARKITPMCPAYNWIHYSHPQLEQSKWALSVTVL